MNAKQELITFIGIALIALTIWQHWRDDVKAVLFNATPSTKPKLNAGGSITGKTGTKSDSAGNNKNWLGDQLLIDPNTGKTFYGQIG